MLTGFQPYTESTQRKDRKLIGSTKFPGVKSSQSEIISVGLSGIIPQYRHKKFEMRSSVSSVSPISIVFPSLRLSQMEYFPEQVRILPAFCNISKDIQ